MKKRVVTILSMFCFLFALVGCSTESPKAEGKYILTQVDNGDFQMEYADFEAAGLEDSYISFEKESKGEFYFYGISTEITIDEEKQVIKSDTEQLPYELDGDKLVITESSGTLTYYKEGSDALHKIIEEK